MILRPLQNTLRAGSFLAILLWAMAGTATAWAEQDADCGDEQSTPAVDFYDAMTLLHAQQATPLYYSPTSACSRLRGSSISSGNCGQSVTYPMSTVPEWLAVWHAEEALTLVFDAVDAMPSEKLSPTSPRSQPRAPQPEWMRDLLQEIARTAAAMPAERDAVCFVVDGDTCQGIPTLPGMACPHSISTLSRPTHDLDVEPLRLDGWQMQSALVDLRVGPALGYRRLPDRPPPV